MSDDNDLPPLYNEFIISILENDLHRMNEILANEAFVNHEYNINDEVTVHGVFGTPLLHAYRRKCPLAMLERLLQQGADPNRAILHDDSYTILFDAVYYTDIERLRLLLQYKAHVNDDNNDNKETPLLFVLRDIHDHEELNPDRLLSCVRILLQHGANVNHRNRFGETSLFILCRNIECIRPRQQSDDNMDHTARVTVETVISCIRLLLEYQADVNIPIHNGMTPLYSIIDYRSNCCCSTYHLHVGELLLQHGANVTLPITTRRRSGDYSNHLLSNGRMSTTGDTVLHCAVRRNKKEFVQLLLREEYYHPPIVKIRNANEENVFDIAKRFGHDYIFECYAIKLRHQCYQFLHQQWIQPIDTVTHYDDDDDKPVPVATAIATTSSSADHDKKKRCRSPSTSTDCPKSVRRCCC